MMYDTIEDLKFNLHLTLDALYLRLHETRDAHDRAYLRGQIDAYEEILGEL